MIRKRRTKDGRLRYSPRVHLGDGRYRMLGTFETLGEAREEEARWLLERGATSRKRGGEWAAFWLAGYKLRVKRSSHDTAQTAVKRWRERFETRRLATITPTEAETWSRENGWAVPVVVTMLNHAVRHGLIARNPFAGLSKKGPGRKYLTPLTPTQVEELAMIAENRHGIGAFVRFAAYTGMRIGEIFALEWSDVDFERSRIMVRRRIYRGEMDSPKGLRPGEIALLPEARDALLALPRKEGRIFRAKRGGNMTHSVLAYYWQAIAAVFGPVEPHELRHFCGHYLYVTKGLPARVVAAQLRHSSPRLVEDLYGHGDVGALEAIDNVVPLRRSA